MANVTAWDTTTKAAIIEASTTVATVTLLPELEYELYHLGTDAAGNAQAADLIMLSLGSAVPAQSTGANKLILQPGEYVRIGPGVSTLKYDATANDPAFNITANVYRGGKR